MNKLIYIVLLVFLFSCKKEEIPVAKHLAGDIITNSFEMGTDYKKQAFFDLNTNSFISENIKTSWDLGFESSESGSHIILNSANFMFVGKVIGSSFNSITDTTGLEWHCDDPSGNFNSTAIGDWQNDNAVYVVNRGSDHLGISRGFCKIEFQSVTAIDYTFRIANLDGSLEEQVVVNKDSNYNYIALSCDTRTSVSIEPHKESWDIQFTQYTHIFTDLDHEYLVTGVLTNRNNVQVAQVFDKSYSDISFGDVGSYSFSSDINLIGYDWKFYDFSVGSYTINLNQNYIVKTTEGLYYKIHFIDFYNGQGDKGTPVFEIQEL